MKRLFDLSQLLILAIVLPLFVGCDKKGNLLFSPEKFRCEINGIEYIDRQPILIPPGAQRSPQIIHQSGSKVENYVMFTSSLTKVGEEDANKFPEYDIRFNIPEGDIQVGQKYEFHNFPGNDVVEWKDNVYPIDIPYTLIYSITDLNILSYGTGTVVFSKYDLTAKVAKGRVEFSFRNPINDGKGQVLKFTGDFQSWINKLIN